MCNITSNAKKMFCDSLKSWHQDHHYCKKKQLENQFKRKKIPMGDGKNHSSPIRSPKMAERMSKTSSSKKTLEW